MKLIRLCVSAVFTAVIATALLLDNSVSIGGVVFGNKISRDISEVHTPIRHSLAESWPHQNTWFCPGGSAPGGIADVSIEIINASAEASQALVTGIRQGLGVIPTEALVRVEAGERSLVRLADLVPESSYMGAVVEVDSADMIVEQTYLGASGTTDRALCQTRTSDLWLVPSGATRLAEKGEEMVLLVLNPFPHDAVLNIRFASDVGVDTRNGVVVPARRVLALDVASEVPVAEQISATVNVVFGRVVVSRVQSRGLPLESDEQFPAALSVTPAVSTLSPLWYLLDLNNSERIDVVTVLNPSSDEVAGVDLELIVDGDSGVVQRVPVELTIAPGEARQVCLNAMQRLEGIGSYIITARSITGLGVAVLHESTDAVSAADPEETPSTCDPELGFGSENISLAATSGLDVGTTRWLAPLRSPDHGISIFNPAAEALDAQVSVIDEQGKRLVVAVNIAPQERARFSAAELGSDAPIVEVVATAPVLVSRDLSGVSQHQLLPAVVASAALSVGVEP
ncbi:MAG: hypothetical protein KTU85_04485 [Acidimicrobiia bacterium]|nr:hypothetical protein [Acidimicrobiia bacterium]